MAKYQSITMASNPKKRQHDTDSDSDNEPKRITVNVTDDWPRFIIIESQDSNKPVAKLSPFAVQKGIEGIAGTVKDVKQLRSGSILVECAKKAHAVNLQSATTLAGIPITASPHRTLNTSKGVIRTKALDDIDEEEIAQELKSQSVQSVKRITIKKDGNIIKTGTYIITFCKPTPPESLKLGYLNVRVSVFIPRPLRCFQCQKFGHGKDSCRNQPTCMKCSIKGHSSLDCENPAKCSNCQGDHAAASKNCPVFLKESNIQKVKTERKVSYPEARRLVEATTTLVLPNSYASVVRAQTKETECQTEFTWLVGPQPKKVENEKRTVQNGCSSTQTQTQTESQSQTQTQTKCGTKVKLNRNNSKVMSDRLSKAEKNALTTHNRFQVMEDMEADCEPSCSNAGHSHSQTSKKQKGKVPVKKQQ